MPDKNVPEKKANKKEKKNAKKPNVFLRIAKWLRELRSELKKVTWSTPKQIFNNTCVALGVMFASALVIWGVDVLAELSVDTIITLFS